MAAAVTTADLLARFRDLDLLEPKQLEDAVRLASGELPDAASLAHELRRRGWLTSFQTGMLLAGNADGLLLDQYILLQLLGEGGMGQVFKAKHRLMHRVVALKVIRPEAGLSQANLTRFLREIRAVGQLHHPNVVIAHDANTHNGVYFLVMEYIAGVDLSRLVKARGPLPVGQACECIRQAALGLQHAHERGLVHRDIKPSNLLLSVESKQVKLLDLGLARLQGMDVPDEPKALTHTGQVMGTPDYMAPEQARDAASVDIRADLYSLGCTLFYLLAGRTPFIGKTTFMEKLTQHIMDPPPDLTEVQPETPLEVAAVVRKLLMKNPAERYQTPAELAAVLAPFAKPLAVSPDMIALSNEAQSDPSDMTGSHTSQGRNPRTTGSAGSASEPTAGVGSGLRPGASLSRTDGLTRGPLQVTQLPRSAGESAGAGKGSRGAMQWLVAGLVVVLAAVGGGAFALLNTAPKPDEVAVKPADPPLEKEPPKVEPPPEPKKEPPPPEPKKEPPPPPEPKKEPPPPPEPKKPGLLERLEGHTAPITGVAISPDGRRAASADKAYSIRVWDLESGRQAPINFANLVEDLPWSVAFTPDGQHLLTGGGIKLDDDGSPRRSRERFVHVWSLTGPTLQFTLAGHKDWVQWVASHPTGNRVVSASLDRTARVWNPRAKVPLEATFTGHPVPVTAAVFSRDGETVASVGREKTVRLWDARTGKSIRELQGHTDWGTSLAFLADGKLVTGSRDKSARVWDPESGEPVAVIDTGAEVFAVAAAGSDRVVIGGADGVVRVYDARTGRAMAAFPGHDGPIHGVAVSPDGTRAVSGGDDRALRVWLLPPGN